MYYVLANEMRQDVLTYEMRQDVLINKMRQVDFSR
jgi:hypothetical protein